MSQWSTWLIQKKTYKMLLIRLQKTIIVGHRALVDEALPCASQIDTGVLWDKSNPDKQIIFLQITVRDTHILKKICDRSAFLQSRRDL